MMLDNKALGFKNLISKKESSDINIHIIVALLCLPLYQFGGEAFKYVAAPYVLYLLFRMEPKFIPALILHFMDGTTISFLILVACAIISLINFRKLKLLKVRILLIGCLLALPLFLITLYLKFTIYNESLISIINFMFMYLGFFPFFYFLLLAQKFKKIHIEYIIAVLVVTVIIQLFVKDTIRYIFFSIPFFLTLLALSLKQKNVNKLLFFVFSSFMMLVLFVGFSSTLIFTSLVSVLIALYYNQKKFLTTKISYILAITTIFIVGYSIYSFNPSTQSISGYDISKETLDVLDINSIIDRAKFKLFEDRTPIWFSVYDNFVANGTFLIPAQLKDYTYFTLTGNEIETDIAAHNIFLELIRIYGVLTGILLSFIYIAIIIKSSYIWRIKRLNMYLIAISACVVSCGFFGGMTGQYLLLGTFSFLFMGLAGLCYGIYQNRNQKQKNTDNIK